MFLESYFVYLEAVYNVGIFIFHKTDQICVNLVSYFCLWLPSSVLIIYKANLRKSCRRMYKSKEPTIAFADCLEPNMKI